MPNFRKEIWQSPPWASATAKSLFSILISRFTLPFDGRRFFSIVSRSAFVSLNLLVSRVRTASWSLFRGLVFGHHQYLSFIRHMAVHIFRLSIEHLSDSAFSCKMLLGLFFFSLRIDQFSGRDKAYPNSFSYAIKMLLNEYTRSNHVTLHFQITFSRTLAAGRWRMQAKFHMPTHVVLDPFLSCISLKSGAVWGMRHCPVFIG